MNKYEADVYSTLIQEFVNLSTYSDTHTYDMEDSVLFLKKRIWNLEHNLFGTLLRDETPRLIKKGMFK